MRKHPFLKALFFSLFILVVSQGCGKKGSSSGVSEGVIEYEAEAIDKTHPMADLAPNKMIVRFKDNMSCIELSAGMGLFSTTFISNPDNFTMTQLVKLLNKRYVHVFDTNELKQENSGPKMVIEKTNETKVIASYKCKKAIVKFPGSQIPSFEVFYTNEIGIENPNWCNPFAELDGVLMQYQMKRHGIELRFTAKSVSSADVDDSMFEVPEEYKAIDKKELDELFNAFQ